MGLESLFRFLENDEVWPKLNDVAICAHVYIYIYHTHACMYRMAWYIHIYIRIAPFVPDAGIPAFKQVRSKVGKKKETPLIA